tara:strand:+ start:279 stop:524 length:246 start_codon:yes stop_codon:yes gene_type:complete
MSKAAIQKKWGKAGLSKVVQARLLLKKQGKDIGKIARQASKSKKGSPRGMVGKTKKGQPSKKDMMAEADRFSPFRKPREKR